MEISHKKYQSFLGIFSAIGFVFVALVTWQCGAGVSSDAARNLSAGESIAAGRGFVDMVGFTLLWWPPLYPLMLAGFKIATGASAFKIAWYLNALLYPMNIWLWGELLYRVFEKKTHYAMWSVALMVLSRSTLRVYANVFSEPIFLAFVLVFLFAAALYLEKTSRRALWLMTFMAALSFNLRYVGVVLIAVLGLLILYKEGWRALPRAVALGTLAFLPTGLWVYFHNYRQYGLWFGPRMTDQFFPLENVSLMLTKSFNWFVPLHPMLLPLLMRPWIILLAIFFVLVLINKKQNWAEWAKSIASNRYLMPSLLLTVLYLTMMAFTVNTIDHRDLSSDRYYVIIFPVLLAVLMMTLDKLILSHVNLPWPRIQMALGALFLFSLAYPIFSVQEYIRKALIYGEPTSYNVHNTVALANLPLFKAAHEIVDKDPNALLYSNYAPMTWFQFQRPMGTLPFQDASLPQIDKLAALKKDFSWWPPTLPVYIVWFTPNEYTHYAPPENLETIVDMQLLYQDENGQVFIVTGKK